MLKVDAGYIRTIAPFMAQKDLRYYLNGVCIEPFSAGGVVIAATDGHTLALAWDKDGTSDERVILNLAPATIAACRVGASVFNLSRSTVRGAQRHVVVGDDKLLRVQLQGGFDAYIQPGNPLIDGKFPDFWRLFKTPEAWKPGAPSAYNSKYIARFADIKHPHNAQGCAIKFFCAGHDDALLVRLEGRDDFVGLVMPMRYGDTNPIPSWLRGALPKAEEKKAA